jgi:adenosyl cobinamide kinase/adenosyl cobinamide phosphate guanylyltransferase
MPFVFVLGGARSGKSALAQRLAAASGLPVVVVATAEPRDADMAQRIRRHQAERPPAWGTVEAPLDLLGAARSAPTGSFLIVDCLTLWVSNLLEAGHDPSAIGEAAASVADEVASHHAVVVSNEVGLGVVPDNELARTFRDTLGHVNAVFASRAERSLLLVAGRALELRGADDLLGLPPD